ncbi:chymotrypsin-elastase inhibitor ixodidin-like [Venturia canescens]|uniref:chymotrypsin-elastase inhibitor ixodidin-like n=1 Tax=Venturia canescens TaxID=32260 RepID=UPI001C9CEF5C|nr:chymotrypsin-elastase inhibitor ixodidin-like [Venturia canescens]
MSRAVFFLLVVAVVAMYSHEVNAQSDERPEPGCGPNEVYDTCGNPCPQSCNAPKIQACATVCVAGCFCEEGFLRDELGRCIPYSECPRR